MKLLTIKKKRGEPDGSQRNSYSYEELLAEPVGPHSNLPGLCHFYVPWPGSCQHKSFFASELSFVVQAYTTIQVHDRLKVPDN